MKRGFVSDTTRIVGSIIVLGLLFLLGVRFIASMTEGSKNAAMERFENSLKSDISAIKTKDSLRTYEYSIPSDIDQICFVDNEADPDDLTEHPFIKAHVVGQGRDNMFIYSKGEVSSQYINGIGVAIYPYFECYETEGQKIILKMLGKANTAMLIPKPNVEMCEHAEMMGRCYWLNIFYTEYQEECCNEYQRCC